MMKKLLFLFFFSCSLLIIAQVTNDGEPASWTLDSKAAVSAISLPQVDIQQIKAQDMINDEIQAKPFRIGVPHRVSYGLNNAGTWTQLPNGDRIWRMLFSSKDAVHLSLIFDKFSLPQGAKVYLYNNERTDLIGAYTDTNNNEKEVLGTWFINGDKLWIEYYEPKNVRAKGKLNISTVIHGYRLGHSYQKGYYNNVEKALNDSGDCNHDVDCTMAADFAAERDLLKKAVAFLLMPDGGTGAFICSGTLVNNTAEDKTPYFLTANHCSGTDPALYSMRFNWISPDPVCAATTNSTDSPDNFTMMSGATLRANNADSDVMLVEINSAIPAGWDVTYAGWDITDSTPSFVVGIHHPQGDIMKICRDDSGVIKAQNSAGGSPVADTWEITTAGGGWELGVTEGGSSGSALFDPNGRIIGQLYGGGAACIGTNDNGLLDFYGRFAVSWNNGTTASTRLSDWLDPLNTPELTTLDALDNVLGVNDEILEQNIRVFPNPTSGVLQIKVKEWVNELYYEVYNVLGQTLKSNELQPNEIINLDKLPSDIYFIKITEKGTNRSLVKKIVLNK